MIYEIVNLVIGVSVLTGIVVLIMSDDSRPL